MISAPAQSSQRLTTSASTFVLFPFQKSVGNVVFDTAVVVVGLMIVEQRQMIIPPVQHASGDWML